MGFGNSRRNTMVFCETHAKTNRKFGSFVTSFQNPKNDSRLKKGKLSSRQKILLFNLIQQRLKKCKLSFSSHASKYHWWRSVSVVGIFETYKIFVVCKQRITHMKTKQIMLYSSYSMHLVVFGLKCSKRKCNTNRESTLRVVYTAYTYILLEQIIVVIWLEL